MYELVIYFFILLAFAVFLSYQFWKMGSHMKILKEELIKTQKALEVSKKKEETLQDRLSEMLCRSKGLCL